MSWIMPLFAITLLLALSWLLRQEWKSWAGRFAAGRQRRDDPMVHLTENPHVQRFRISGLRPAEIYARYGRRG